MADTYGQLTRLGALSYWWRRQHVEEVPGWLIGHGMGASRRGNLVVGEIARRQPFQVDRTGAAIVLWEVGVLGLAAWLAGMAGMTALAWRLARSPQLGPEAQGLRWLLQGAASMLLLVMLSLPYGADFIEAPQLQTAGLLMMGVVLAAARGLISGAKP